MKGRTAHPKPGSPVWNAINSHIIYLRGKSYWEVGNGEERIDKFLWHMDRPRTSEFAGLSIKEVLTHRPLRHKFLHMVPEAAARYYKSVEFMPTENSLRWLEATNGEFSSSKYIEVRRKAWPKVKWGSNIWQPWLHPRFSLLVWRIIHKGLPLDINVRKLGIQLVSCCSCCMRQEESLTHLFFEGDWASRLWGFLEDIFEHRRPRSVESLINDWLGNHDKMKAKAHLKLGLTCIGLHYIWRIRNTIRHDEKITFDNKELIKWAGFLINTIPKRNMDSADFRRIQMTLGIPYNIRSTIEGRWAVWTANKQGYTMDVAISDECDSTAIIIRDTNGNFVVAGKKKIQPIQHAVDLICIIDSWRNFTRLKISNIKYAHHFTYPRAVTPRGVCMEKVHPLVLRASLSLCYSNHAHSYVDKTGNLPLATQRLIRQDKDKLYIFCREVEDSGGGSRDGVHSDDNPNRSFGFQRNLFSDDTKI